jgi:hypothetical protein
MGDAPPKNSQSSDENDGDSTARRRSGLNCVDSKLLRLEEDEASPCAQRIIVQAESFDEPGYFAPYSEICGAYATCLNLYRSISEKKAM